MENRIGIVGDLHIAPVPSQRIDNYFEVGLKKIEEIASYCKHVIFLGDIFTSPKVDELYVTQMIRTLNHLKLKNNNVFYTIIGNHDVQNELEEKLDNSSLGILKACDVINTITFEEPKIIKIGNIKYRFNTLPVNYKTAISDKYFVTYNTQGYQDILLLHHEFETGTHCFTYNDLKNRNCKRIFFGHDHKPMDGGRTIYPEFIAYRSGSIMRNRADDYNFTRQLYYYVIENDIVTCKAINQSPAQSVFKIEALTKQNYNKTKFLESLDEFIDKYKNVNTEQSSFSIKTVLQELNAPEQVIEYIKEKYHNISETFN